MTLPSKGILHNYLSCWEEILSIKYSSAGTPEDEKIDTIVGVLEDILVGNSCLSASSVQSLISNTIHLKMRPSRIFRILFLISTVTSLRMMKRTSFVTWTFSKPM
jgi:hypothetical protein